MVRGSGRAGSDAHGQERSELVASVLVHDLTNHLHIIEGQADFLLDQLDDSAVVDRLTTIKRQTVAANSLVQSVYGLAEEPTRNHLDVGRVLRNEIQQLRSAYARVDVTSDVPDGIAVRADELVASVLWNLLQNAVQHNESPTPHVSVTARSIGSRVVVTVEDDGPGLPDGVERELLGVEPARPGSGVGVIRALADRYDATISVDTGPDGTAISVDFPGEPRSKDS